MWIILLLLVLVVIYVDYLAAVGVGFHPWYTFFGKNPFAALSGQTQKTILSFQIP